jgi:hypothetical protein
VTARAKAADRNKVQLMLSIAGLGPRGCDVEIKPAYPGCTFQTVARHVRSDGKLTLEVDDVRTESPDRDCTFSITLREPGQPERTVHRGLRLKPPGSAGAQFLECFLSSPSRIARTNAQDAVKR